MNSQEVKNFTKHVNWGMLATSDGRKVGARPQTMRTFIFLLSAAVLVASTNICQADFWLPSQPTVYLSNSGQYSELIVPAAKQSYAFVLDLTGCFV